jgi:hypothetical protein
MLDFEGIMSAIVRTRLLFPEIWHEHPGCWGSTEIYQKNAQDCEKEATLSFIENRSDRQNNYVLRTATYWMILHGLQAILKTYPYV